MDVWMNEAREALLQRRSRLRRRADQDKPRVPQDAAGGLSKGDLQELCDIDAALERMKAGEFGRCARCGGPIGRHRLRAIPEARYCLTCSGLVAR
ncbi:MAG: TraR/DksA C4-type zinc finger protein [Myxococcaceae bacterium]|nr:TraR/DksA C4-type zinc finger protein [Myxococcaceae bacterium]